MDRSPRAPLAQELTNRVLLVPPATYALMKKSRDIALESDIGQEQRLRGVIGILDGASVVKVPAVRLPAEHSAQTPLPFSPAQ